jgi:MazG family protein
MQDKSTLDDALSMMRDLRERCDWDHAQTHDSLRPYLIEEVHELDDAIREGNVPHMRDELGDVLLQVLFHSVIAEERGEFDAGDVAGALIGKMRARHPHLYGTGERVPWETMKARSRSSIDEGLPSGLPALHRAHRLQERAAGLGFDWPDVTGPAAKVEEELGEVRELLATRPRETVAPGGDAVPTYDEAHAELEGELGDLLFACVNLCRRAGVHAAVALDRANEKFVRRFQRMETLARERGEPLREEMWEEVKRAE